MKLAIIHEGDTFPICSDEELSKWCESSDPLDIAPFVLGLIIGSVSAIEDGMLPRGGELQYNDDD